MLIFYADVVVHFALILLMLLTVLFFPLLVLLFVAVDTTSIVIDADVPVGCR
jgi:hypothetical protein